MSPLPVLPDPDAIASAVATCPSVAGLSGGYAGEVATYLPGRRIPGVRIESGSVEVHVIARYGVSLSDIATQVRRAVASASPGVASLNVVVADIQDPFEPDPPPPALPPAGAVPTKTTDATAPALPAAPAP